MSNRFSKNKIINLYHRNKMKEKGIINAQDFWTYMNAIWLKLYRIIDRTMRQFKIKKNLKCRV